MASALQLQHAWQPAALPHGTNDEVLGDVHRQCLNPRV